MLIAWLAFFGGFIGLIGGGELLVATTSSLALGFNVPTSIVATTIIAFGSSLPELFISVFAALNQNPGLCIGNVLGSNMQNIALVLGFAALVKPFASDRITNQKLAPFFLGSPALLFILGVDSYIGPIGGAILLFAFALFIYATLNMAKGEKNGQENYDEIKKHKKRFWLNIFGIAFGLVLLFGSARLTLFGATQVAQHFGLSDRVIGLTIVAFGTSLPELFICIVAAYRNKASIIVGNIIGSNIYNILAIVGTSAVIAPMSFVAKDFLLDLIMVGIFTISAFLVFKYSRLIGRAYALFLIATCILYNVFLIV